MTAIEFLKRAANTKIEIACISAQLESLTAFKYEIQKYCENTRVEQQKDTALQCMSQLEQRLMGRICDLMRFVADVDNLLMQMKTPLKSSILRYRYLQRYTLEKIRQCIGLSYTRTHELFDQAVAEFEKIYNRNKKQEPDA